MIAPAARTAPAGRPASPSRGTEVAARPETIGELLTRVTHEPTADDAALDAERQAFEFALKVQAEREREMNALRDLAMEQVKRDDEVLKKWIALI
ncbi:MAG: hypothetical protein NVS2B17_13420 [Candidatus Velthaea sp.]